MNHITKNILTIISIAFFSAVLISSCNSASETHNKNMSFDSVKEKNNVVALIQIYKTATEKLDTTGTAKLFAYDAQVIEGGNLEGAYSHYEKNHIGTEFPEFQSFTFSNYQLEIKLNYPAAVAIESYGYEIKMKHEPTEVFTGKGVTTFYLMKEGEEWKIMNMHLSFKDDGNKND